jgi:crotonobetainyl-CoA:carnitine CoA-transferase CaiB-like acyl-CoA transferase
MKPPLEGIRILELTTVMLGPFAAQMLGDYGADVIKIEAPEGDSTRRTGPATEQDMAATFLGANRNKRSIVLDLKQADGREALLKLIDTADVLLYSMRPQKLKSLGLAPEVLRTRNPNLIVAGIHGFANGGPYEGRPAYDDIIQGMSGLAALSEMKGQEPAYLPTVVADKVCGVFATQAILMALIARTRDGHGSFVEVPMFETMTHFTLVEHFYGQHFRPPLSEPGYPRLLTPWRRPYQTLDAYVCIIPYTDQHWQQFFHAVGQPEFLNDPRFQGLAARTQNIDALYAALASHVRQESTAYWLETCQKLDIPSAPYNRLSDLEHDPQLVASGFFQQMQDPHMGTLVTTGAPLRFEGERSTPRFPPRLGQHSREVMTEIGMDELSIAQLIANASLVQSPH